MNTEDIRIGPAILPSHLDGGWALPGGERTDDRASAEIVAGKMAHLINEAEARPAKKPAVNAAPVITRRVADNLRSVVSSC